MLRIIPISIKEYKIKLKCINIIIVFAFDDIFEPFYILLTEYTT